MKIDFVSDVACPWCAVGLYSLEKALARLGDEVPVELHFEPFELNPAMPPEGEDATEYIARKYGAPPEQLAKTRAVLRERGAAVGFTFGERPRIWNTFDAHRLLHWAGLEGVDKQRALKHALLGGVPHPRPRTRARTTCCCAWPARSASTSSGRAPILASRRVRRRRARARALLAGARHPFGAGDGHRRPAPDLGRPAARGLRAGAAAPEIRCRSSITIAGTEWMPRSCQKRSRSCTASAYSSNRGWRGPGRRPVRPRGQAQQDIARAGVLGIRVIRREKRVLELALLAHPRRPSAAGDGHRRCSRCASARRR